MSLNPTHPNQPLLTERAPAACRPRCLVARDIERDPPQAAVDPVDPDAVRCGRATGIAGRALRPLTDECRGRGVAR